MSNHPGCNQHAHKCGGGAGAHGATTSDHAGARPAEASARELRHRRAVSAAAECLERDPESTEILRMDPAPHRGNLRLRQGMISDWADRSTTSEAYSHVRMDALIDAVWGLGVSAAYAGDHAYARN